MFVLDNNRGFIYLKGPDAKTYLQGLVTNDVEQVNAEKTIYTALLTPQGRYLFDFFISQDEDGLLLDVDYERLQELLSLLKKYKLRAQVEITAENEPQTVACVFGDDVFSKLGLESNPGFTSKHSYVDPRLAALGARSRLEPKVLNDMGFTQVESNVYDHHRLSHGIPRTGLDLLVEKSIPLECGLDELNAIGWEKGCYLGQELTARTKYRGLVRKRLLPVHIEGQGIEPQATLTFEGEEIGSMRSSQGDKGLALIRLEVLDKLGPDGYLSCQQTKVRPQILPWMKFHS